MDFPTTVETTPPRTVADLIFLLSLWPPDAELGNTDISLLESPGVQRVVIATDYEYKGDALGTWLTAWCPVTPPSRDPSAESSQHIITPRRSRR
jgi:hypothetical protein